MRSAVDYEAVFKALAAPLLVVTPEFTIVAANDAYLEETGRERADLLGRHYFAVFPGNPNAPDDPDARGAERLRASLERVLATGERDTMPPAPASYSASLSSGRADRARRRPASPGDRWQRATLSPGLILTPWGPARRLAIKSYS